ncbi:hypothetical protein OF83DRAFT_1088371, partial [Amylostereum chailletii]
SSPSRLRSGISVVLDPADDKSTPQNEVLVDLGTEFASPPDKTGDERPLVQHVGDGSASLENVWLGSLAHQCRPPHPFYGRVAEGSVVGGRDHVQCGAITLVRVGKVEVETPVFKFKAEQGQFAGPQVELYMQYFNGDSCTGNSNINGFRPSFDARSAPLRFIVELGSPGRLTHVLLHHLRPPQKPPLAYWGPNTPRTTASRVPGAQTNNRGELYTTLLATKYAFPPRPLKVHSDSQYATYWAPRHAACGWLCENDDLLACIAAWIRADRNDHTLAHPCAFRQCAWRQIGRSCKIGATLRPPSTLHASPLSLCKITINLPDLPATQPKKIVTVAEPVATVTPWKGTCLPPDLAATFQSRMNPAPSPPPEFNHIRLQTNRLRMTLSARPDVSAPVDSVFERAWTGEELRWAKHHIKKHGTKSATEMDNIDNDAILLLLKTCNDAPTAWLTTAITAMPKRGNPLNEAQSYRTIWTPMDNAVDVLKQLIQERGTIRLVAKLIFDVLAVYERARSAWPRCDGLPGLESDLSDSSNSDGGTDGSE